MAKKGTGIPKVENLNLLSKVSTSLQELLNKYQIDYTKGDITILRRSIISGLNDIGINESNYDNKENDEIKIYTINLKINNFYKTNHGVDTPERERKINKLERFSD